MTINEILKNAKRACKTLNNATAEQKNAALLSMADSLEANADAILEANQEDIKNARGHISDVMIDRLSLNYERIAAMANGIREVAALPDPVGRILATEKRPNGLVIKKTSVPFGVVAIIYESRPNVTSDAAALAIKSGNTCVLRGGKEAFNSSSTIVNVLRNGIENAGLCPEILNIIQDISRESAIELMTANGFVDLLLPRGGAGLINSVVKNATVPCIQTGTGICHIYVDESADIQMALDIVENAKASRPSVCNAAEVCLVHEKIAAKFLPELKKRLVDDRAAASLPPVELRLCKKAAKMVAGKEACEADFDTEFLDYILAVKIVSSTDDAIHHIAKHSTGHSESIITSSTIDSNKFFAGVDSAAVYVNASTRFTDGGEFGLGCEMGISTQKMHARGPIGLNELTTYKYIIKGNGQVR